MRFIAKLILLLALAALVTGLASCSAVEGTLYCVHKTFNRGGD